MITGDESENQEVLGEIVKLWITIRGLQFVYSHLPEQLQKNIAKPQRRELQRLKVLGLNWLLMNLIKLAIMQFHKLINSNLNNNAYKYNTCD